MPFEKLSILIPAYDERFSIREIVSLVLAQELPGGLERELVIVDDGSTDGTREILEQLRQAHPEHVRIHFHETNLTDCPVYERALLPTNTPIPGPAILEETSSTVIIYPNQQAQATRWGTITITNR